MALAREQIETLPRVKPPWDQRLARLLVSPLAKTSVHPNHLTTLSLLLGLGSGLLFAVTEFDLAAGLFMLAVLCDHADGELARLTNKTSRLGHIYDYLAGGLNYTAVFSGIGVGLYRADVGLWALLLGLAAGLANPIILTLRMRMDKTHGSQAVEHPRVAGFELEDGIYLIGPIVWIFGAVYFLVVYAVGTLGYLAWTITEYRHWRPSV